MKHSSTQAPRSRSSSAVQRRPATQHPGVCLRSQLPVIPGALAREQERARTDGTLTVATVLEMPIQAAVAGARRGTVFYPADHFNLGELVLMQERLRTDGPDSEADSDSVVIATPALRPSSSSLATTTAPKKRHHPHRSRINGNIPVLPPFGLKKKSTRKH